MPRTHIKTDQSRAAFAQSQALFPGGVNSPVRAYGAVGGTPRFVERAEGPYLYDLDGQRYVDYVGSWGPMILGHVPKAVVKALSQQVKKGTSFGAPSAVEIELAAMIKNAYPSIDLVRLMNSGTEATMTAIRLARGLTKRERLLKFEGGYHGHSDSLLVAAGSGATTFGVPSSLGVPTVLAHNTWVLPFNDTAKLEETFRRQGPNIAAAIVEPVCGNMGVVLPKPGFLEKLRELTSKYETVLIFDEVMTGFRLRWGGAQELYGISPDLTCLGKIIGGGLPVGAVGGKKRIMEYLAPLGPVYQAGTLSGNPLAMTAGLSTLKILKRLKPYAELEKKTADLCSSIRASAKARHISIQVNQVGSMFTIFFVREPVTNYFSASLADVKKYAKFFHALLSEGVYMPPSQFEAAFVSTAHDGAQIEKAKNAFAKALDMVVKSS